MQLLQLKSFSTNGAVALPMARVRAWLSLFTSLFGLPMVALWSQPAEADAI
ncbi:MAG: hypothetical protein U1E02_34175 [Hydrogenophaga sp.]|nr:hypothetical protein [Hydrogenophaga sp.]